MVELQLKKQDVMELLKGVEDETVDLIVLDPYYNDWDKMLKRGILEECFRCLKSSGNLLCFTQQPFDYELRKTGEKNFRREIIWNYAKRPKWVSKNLPLVYHHKILWFVKSKKEHYFDCRSGMDYSEKTQFGNKGYMVFEGYKEKLSTYSKHPEGVWLPDVLTFDKPHKTTYQGQKPQELMEVLLKCFSPEAGVVIDPFIGYGTTFYAAQNSSRKILGGDINDCHFKEMLSKAKVYND